MLYRFLRVIRAMSAMSADSTTVVLEQWQKNGGLCFGYLRDYAIQNAD